VVQNVNERLENETHHLVIEVGMEKGILMPVTGEALHRTEAHHHHQALEEKAAQAQIVAESLEKQLPEGLLALRSGYEIEGTERAVQLKTCSLELEKEIPGRGTSVLSKGTHVTGRTFETEKHGSAKGIGI